jgi:uncharacterized membrane protein
MKRDACTWVKALISAAAVTFLLTAGWSQNAPRLILLLPLPGFDSSEALSVSANGLTNGLTVVGNSFRGDTQNPREQQRAVYWQIPENNNQVFVFAQPLDSPDQNDFSAAFDVSANGKFAVGFVRSFVQTNQGLRAVLRAVRWTVGSTRTVLPVPPNTENTVAFAISAAGNVVAGRAGAFTPGNFGDFLGGILDQGSAVRWEITSSSLKVLPGIEGADRTAAAAVSDDGSTLAGASGTGDDLNNLNLVAVVWEGVNGPRVIPERARGFAQSTVLDCSPYGNAFVGISFNDTQNYIASYWRDRGRQFVQLTSTSTAPSLARRISGDGSEIAEIVGQIGTSDAGRAYLWRYRNGRVEEIDLNDLVRSLPPGVTLETAFGISPNGRFIVGRAREESVVIGSDGSLIIQVRRVGFLLDRRCPLNADVNRDGVVDDADLLQVLFAFGGRGYTNEDTNWDGIVDDRDLSAVLFSFNNICPPSP